MIVTLSQEEIEEYGEQYDASHLEAGMRVFCDGEMYFTDDQLSEAIWRIEGSLAQMGDPLLTDMREELNRLKAALAEFDQPDAKPFWCPRCRYEGMDHQLIDGECCPSCRLVLA